MEIANELWLKVREELENSIDKKTQSCGIFSMAIISSERRKLGFIRHSICNE